VSAVTTHFEHVVRSKLIANKLAGTKPDSIRGLARAMANGDETVAQTYKRSLFKWMSRWPRRVACFASACSCAPWS